MVALVCLIFAVTGCSKEVENYDYSVEFEGKEYKGTYTGTIEDKIPNGEGKFEYERGNNYFVYQGAWEEGEMNGEGELDTNFYVVHFKGLNRTGTYTGETKDGLASGEGEFSAKNDKGEKYTYTGNFENGTFNGPGKKVFEKGEYRTEIGNYKNGEFTPTVKEFILAESTTKNASFNVSDNAQKILEENVDMFTGKKGIPDDMVNSNFSYKRMAKSPSTYGKEFIKVNGLEVNHIMEWEEEGLGTVTFALLSDRNYDYYYVYLPKRAKNIFEGDYVSLTALPLDYFTYESVSNINVWAVAFAGASITK